MKQNDIFKKKIIPYSIYHANENIAKLVTLMVEGHLNKVMRFKCNTCIIL